MANMPSNVEAENGVLICALVQPDAVLESMIRLGLTPEKFHGSRQKRMFAEMLRLKREHTTIDGVTLAPVMKSMEDLVTDLDEVHASYSLEAAEDYARLILECSWKRDVITFARNRATPLIGNNGPSAVEMAVALRDEMNSIILEHARSKRRKLDNPADALEREDRWSVRVGIPWFDDRLRLTSGVVHGIGGDSNIGKSLVADQTAGFNARAGVPVAVFKSEDKVLDFQLNLLSQLKEGIDTLFISRIKYDDNFKTEENLRIVRDLWDTHYSKVAIVATSIRQGPQELLAAIEALPEPHYVVIDHAYAIVIQGESKFTQEHRDFSLLYSGLENLADSGNHVILIFNQFKLSERKATLETRSADAQYGGSVIQNACRTMVHMWKPTGNDVAQCPYSGWYAIRIECLKVKDRLVANEAGIPIDPLDGPGLIYGNVKHRIIGDPAEGLNDIMF